MNCNCYSGVKEPSISSMNGIVKGQKVVALINKLPMEVELHLQYVANGKVVNIGSLKYNEAQSYPMISVGDQLAVYDKQSGKILLEPFQISLISAFLIGGINYAVESAQLNLHNLTADIPNLWIYNELSMPISFFYKSNKIAIISGKNVTNAIPQPLQGGYGNELYFENFGYGVNIGDEVGYAIGRTAMQPTYIAVLSDKWIREVHVGNICPVNM